MQNEVFLSAAQLCRRYNVKAAITIRRWWQAGYLPAPVRIGGSVRWKLSDLENFEQTQLSDRPEKPREDSTADTNEIENEAADTLAAQA